MKNNIVELENKIYIEDLKINLDGYEAKIIYNEKIDGLANCRDIGDTYIVYEKIGTTLEEHLKNNKLSAKDLINYIEDIDRMLNQLENYLLSENSICLRLDLTLICDHHLQFLAIPNYKQDFLLELSRFLVRILRFIDVKDKMALSLAYKLFIRISKDNYAIDDLLDIAREADNVKN